VIKNHIIYSNFCDWTLTLKKAKDSFIWNEKGQKLIDFTSGWNVTNLGWNNVEVNEAIIKQAKKNTYASMWMNDEIQSKYANELAHALPKPLNLFVRATGGTDANEKAMLLARSLTKRKKIIGFRDTYHGHSFGTISIGYRPEYTLDVAPVVPEFIKVNFPKSSGNAQKDETILEQFTIQLKKLLAAEDIAAVITEAGIISGWGSTFVAPKGYVKTVRNLTQKYGTLLILDEVGTGFSRCGKLFGMEIENVVPDMTTFAKGMSNGAAAIGAVAVSSRFDEKVLTAAKTHSTFGWTPVACAASLKTLQIHKRDRPWEKSLKDGNYLMTELKEQLKSHPKLGEIQGLGMEIGITFVKNNKSKLPDDEFTMKVVTEAYKNGLYMYFGGDGNIQIMPPLTTPKKVLNEGIEILVAAVKSVS